MRTARRIVSLFRRGKLDSEMSEEIRLHLELQTERNIAAGMDADEARYAAKRTFGGVEQVKERCREQRGWVWIETLGKDLIFAMRRLRRTPAFTVTALATLGLCIGANTVIFSAVNAVVLRPLPFPEPERLMTVINSYPGAGYPHAGPSIPNYFARREAIDAFAGVALWAPITAVVGEPGSVRQIQAARVTPEFFSTLGVPLAMGGMFTDAALTYQTAAVVVLTDEFWRSQFNADPEIVGKTLFADGLPSTIIGVLPRGFRFLSSQAQFFKPLAFNPWERELRNRHNSLPGMLMIARLARGATLTEAQSQLEALDARQAEVDPSGAFLKEWGYHSFIRPLHADYVREVRPILLLLQCGVLVLLVIGAVNLVNLLLVRTSARGRELAVRQALGAPMSRLMRDAWLEATLLALLGGTLGLGLGVAGVRLLATLGARQLPLGASIAVDGRVAAVVLVAALVLGGLLAAFPVWLMRRLPLKSRLDSETAGGTGGRASQRIRQSFGMVQVALAFVLLCGTGLLGASLRRVLAQPIGFRPDHILTAGITLPWKDYRSKQSSVIFVRRLVHELGGLPGVSDVAVSNSLPFSGFTAGGPVVVEGRTGDASATVRAHHHAGVTTEYWRTMGIPSLRGKLFEAGDDELNRPPVCVVDQALAEIYWPAGDPIGQRLCFGTTFEPASAMTIIGVVGTAKQAQLAETAPMGMIYSPFAQFTTSWFRVVLRTQAQPAGTAESLRKTVEGIDPQLVVAPITTMEEMIDESLIPRRSPLILAAIFAGVAVLLATVGTYGVLACAVSHRRREIGLRMALGAMPAQILRLFLNSGLRLLLGGCILGVFGAWATGRAMRRFLFEVGSFPPMVIGGVVALMAMVIFVAIVIPATRAAAVDPCETLRHE